MKPFVLHPSFQNLFVRAKRAVSHHTPPNVLAALPAPQDMEFLANMTSDGLIVPILVGKEEELNIQWDKLSKSRVYIENAQTRQEAKQLTAQYIRDERAEILLWGGLSASELSTIIGTANGKVRSHVAVVALPGRERLLVISDCGWIQCPDLQETAGIIHNCIDILNAMEVKSPKIAMLSAVEDIDTRIPRTMEAAAISQMSRRGTFAPAVVDGPLRFDHAITISKGLEPSYASPVAGFADCVIAGSIEEANILIKALVHLGQGQFGGLLMGGAVPVAWPTWHDSRGNSFLSLALSILLWEFAGGND